MGQIEVVLDHLSDPASGKQTARLRAWPQFACITKKRVSCWNYNLDATTSRWLGMTRGLGALGAWMILRLWFVLVLVLADAVFSRDVAAQPAPQIPSDQASPAEITPPAPDGLAFLKTPIVFYLAKGEADACGPGCNEWIAAEGSFDPGAMARFRAFLAETRATKLPIYIHSPGGLAGFAYQIGRLIRRQGMTVGVSRTMPEECKGQDEKSCNALKRSGKMLTAELSPFAVCASACVPVLAAGNIRQVLPGARVGVHSPKAVRLYADGRVTIPRTATRGGSARSIRNSGNI
jgi:hypothetical protein